jgi:hypothetical protein
VALPRACAVTASIFAATFLISIAVNTRAITCARHPSGRDRPARARAGMAQPRSEQVQRAKSGLLLLTRRSTRCRSSSSRDVRLCEVEERTSREVAAITGVPRRHRAYAPSSRQKEAPRRAVTGGSRMTDISEGGYPPPPRRSRRIRKADGHFRALGDGEPAPRQGAATTRLSFTCRSPRSWRRHGVGHLDRSLTGRRFEP